MTEIYVDIFLFYCIRGAHSNVTMISYLHHVHFCLYLCVEKVADATTRIIADSQIIK